MEQYWRERMHKVIRGGLIASVYIVLTIMPGLSAISFGPVQFRISEALTVLPILYPEAIAGLFVGALIANLAGPVGLVDVIFGSLATLIAAVGTWRFRHSVWAYWSPVVVNGLLVSLYLHAFFDFPYWLTVLSIGASEALVVFTLGRLLIRKLRQIEGNTHLRR